MLFLKIHLTFKNILTKHTPPADFLTSYPEDFHLKYGGNEFQPILWDCQF